MNTRAALTLGLSTLALCGTVAGITQGGSAVAGSRNETKDEKQALASAQKAQSMLTGGNAEGAIGFAESAVGMRPHVADYRLILGQSYLRAGRFTSARDAFRDALALEPGNGKAALNLSLALIATGDWDGARRMLDQHSDTIAPADRGLAVALAGDPAGGVDVLIAAVRTPGADAKTRQNLALALALAGRWAEARTMVAYDVAPADVEQRITQWAAFAKPHAAYDQVATLLGVRPVEDSGQPVSLALNAATPVTVASKDTTSVDAYMPGQAASAAIAAAVVTPNVPAPVAAPTAMSSGVQFAAHKEVVQALPTAHVAPVRAANAAPTARAVQLRNAVAAPTAFSPMAKPTATGNFYVQLGAYENAAVAKDAWGRMSRRFAGHVPSGMNFSAQGANFYRLSVGGFTQHDAKAMCRHYRAKGGRCFVRTGAGDQTASWIKPGTQLASR